MMMNTMSVTCAFIFVVFVRSSLSTSIYKKEEEKISADLAKYDSTNHATILLDWLAQERVDHAKTKDDVASHVALGEARLEVANQHLAVANQRLGEIKKEKEILQKVHIRLSPRALVDSIQETYELEYYELMNSYRQALEKLRKEETDLPGKITHAENELKNPNLSAKQRAAKQKQLLRLKSKLNEIPKEIGEYEKKLLPKISEENTRGNRIAKRKHMWQWIVKNKIKNSRDVEKIWMYIQQWYGAKDELFKQKYSLEQYTAHICKNIAAVHEQASNDAAHVLERIPLKEGYEFKILRIYGKDDLDEAVTIIVNAVGISHLFHDVSSTASTDVSGTGVTVTTDVTVSILPLPLGSMIQKKSVI